MQHRLDAGRRRRQPHRVFRARVQPHVEPRRQQVEHVGPGRREPGGTAPGLAGPLPPSPVFASGADTVRKPGCSGRSQYTRARRNASKTSCGEADPSRARRTTATSPAASPFVLMFPKIT